MQPQNMSTTTVGFVTTDDYSTYSSTWLTVGIWICSCFAIIFEFCVPVGDAIHAFCCLKAGKIHVRNCFDFTRETFGFYTNLLFAMYIYLNDEVPIENILKFVLFYISLTFICITFCIQFKILRKWQYICCNQDTYSGQYQLQWFACVVATIILHICYIIRQYIRHYKSY